MGERPINPEELGIPKEEAAVERTVPNEESAKSTKRREVVADVETSEADRLRLEQIRDDLKGAEDKERRAEEKPTTVFVTGFGTTAESYGEEWENIREFDPNALAFEADKGIPASPEDYSAFQELGPTPEALVEQVAALDKFLEENDIQNVNLVGQSEGGGIAAAYAARHPERISQLALVSPAGLQGEDSYGRLMSRFVPHVLGGDPKRQSQVHGFRKGLRRAAETGKIFTQRLLQRPGFRLSTETASIANMNILPYLKHAKEHGDFDISLLYGNRDKVFKPDKIEETLGKDPFQYVDRLMMYREKKAPHNAMMIELPGAVRQILEQGKSKRLNPTEDETPESS